MADDKPDPIYVTRPHLPPLDDLMPYLESIWDSHRLTNAGPLHQQLEQALCDYLGVAHISLFANGTLALMTAMQALRLSGEVITTPYSFVATANAMLWNNLRPVFVDVDGDTLNLDPAAVEAAITPHTSAILPVHVYGRPCDTSTLQHLADLYGLRLIYDAAHCFGIRDAGGSLLRHGDLSILSFHATKVFNTFEGGAVISPDEKTKKRVDYLKNFGFADETTVVAGGINGKMNEFQAAVGLAQLAHIDKAIQARRSIDQQYRACLSELAGIRCADFGALAQHNYSYFPIFVGPDYPITRDELYFLLRQHGIHGRRYFYPLIPDFPMYRSALAGGQSSWPNARAASDSVICLPIYPGLEPEWVQRICDLIADPASGKPPGAAHA